MNGAGGQAAAPTPSASWWHGLVVLARRAVMFPIRVYSVAISPAFPRRCKYEPTCSRYALQAIERYGILRGIVLAGWRLLRCNPFSRGGFDPVDAQRLFAPRSAHASAPTGAGGDVPGSDETP